MLTATAIPLLSLSDSYGAPLAEYFLLPDSAELYVRWHGQLTAAEVIRGVQAASQWRSQYSFERILNDKRDTGGDWSEALPWLQYEWLPLAVAAGIRAIAYILSPDLEAQIVSQEFVEAVGSRLNVALFTTEAEAQSWLVAQ